MIDNKKAQGLPITTIILIVLGVAVLVILIIGFTQGWGTLKGWFTGGAGDRYVSECALACSSNNIGGWCDDEYDVELTNENKATLRITEEGSKFKTSCLDLATIKKISNCTSISC